MSIFRVEVNKTCTFLKVGTAASSETLVPIYQIIRRFFREYGDLNNPLHEVSELKLFRLLEASLHQIAFCIDGAR
jgi:hypothetical protein